MLDEEEEMTFISKDKLLKNINELWDWDSLDEKSKNMLKQTIDDINKQKVINAIPIDWLHKQLIELMYERKLSSEVMETFHKLIALWEKEHE